MGNICIICWQPMKGSSNRVELQIEGDLVVKPFCHKKHNKREIENFKQQSGVKRYESPKITQEGEKK